MRYDDDDDDDERRDETARYAIVSSRNETVPHGCLIT